MTKRWKTKYTVSIAVAALAAAGVIGAAAVASDNGAKVPTPPIARFTKPVQNGMIANDGVIRAEGTISDPSGNYQVWLVDNDGSYTADMQVRLVGQNWTAHSEGEFKPGLARGRRAKTRIDLVVADATCAAFLQSKYEADDSTFETLPSGCHVTDERELIVVG